MIQAIIKITKVIAYGLSILLLTQYLVFYIPIIINNPKQPETNTVTLITNKGEVESESQLPYTPTRKYVTFISIVVLITLAGWKKPALGGVLYILLGFYEIGNKMISLGDSSFSPLLIWFTGLLLIICGSKEFKSQNTNPNRFAP